MLDRSQTGLEGVGARGPYWLKFWAMVVTLYSIPERFLHLAYVLPGEQMISDLKG